MSVRLRAIRAALAVPALGLVLAVLATPAVATDFTVQSTGVLGDRVWLDADFDGVFDVGEVGLAGIDVNLAWNDGGAQAATTTTDANGVWSVGSLAFDVPITVTVDSADLPGNMDQTHDYDDSVLSGPIGTAHSAVVTLTAGAPTNNDLDFGYVGAGQVGDTVWMDIDGDGAAAPEVEDLLLEGVEVTVTWPGANGGSDFVTTATSDANGFWVVQALPEGTVTVDVDAGTLPGGVLGTLDPDGGMDNTASIVLVDDLGTGEDETLNYDVDFAWTGAGSIGDRVWYDTDGDGVQDGDELGIDAMTVEVIWYDAQSDPHTWTATTDTSGAYSIPRLPSGFVSVSVPTAAGAGYVATYDADLAHDGTASLSLGSGEDLTNVDFGFRDAADMAVSVTNGGDFRLGETNSWSIEVENLGPGVANGAVEVAAVLPVGTSYFAISGSGAASWSCTPQVSPNEHLVDCTYTPGSIASGNSASFDLDVSVTATAAPSAELQVSVTANSSDATPGNNSDADTADVPLAELAVSMSRLDDLVAGDVVTYRMAVTNNGPSISSGGITLVDELPDGLAFDSFSGDGWTCGPSFGDVVCVHLGVIPVTLTANVDLDLVVLAAAGDSVANTVTVTGGNEVNGSQLDAGAIQAAVGIVDDSMNDTVQSGSGSTTSTTATSTTTTTTVAGGGETTTTSTTTTTTSAGGSGSTTTSVGGATSTTLDGGVGSGAGTLDGGPDELARTGLDIATLLALYTVIAMSAGAILVFATRPIRRAKGSNPIA
ncbi:MAG: hypothetical protein GY708_29035 [Actinomycetia bacterium]|nr:hypothetical protein [Actinomycetes bacterium]MCP4960783.1 hypothetical protein [Actinomycetes bacterium]